MKSLYLDTAATTPVSKDVIATMLPYYTLEYGNPSSPHTMGERAQKAIEDARVTIAKTINAKPWEIFFTSSVTEANNWVISSQKKPIAISSIEHASITEPSKLLEKKGIKVKIIPVSQEGIIKIEGARELIPGSSLVSVMHANNVIGTIQPIKEIGALCRKHGALFHTDAAQTFGKIPIDVKAMQIDFLSASAHKIGGPKGIGFLFIREGVTLPPFIVGGGQERGIRGGTENVPAIVGFAKAVELVKKVNQKKIESMRNFCINEIERIGGMINGSRTQRLSNNIHASFNHIDADTLVAFLSKEKIYIATGSACETKREKEDHVLESIGLTSSLRKGSVRITLSKEVTRADIMRLIKAIDKALLKSRIN